MREVVSRQNFYERGKGEDTICTIRAEPKLWDKLVINIVIVNKNRRNDNVLKGLH